MLTKLWIFFVSFYCFECYTLRNYSFLMPNVHPYVDDLYLCTPVRINMTKNYYIVSFEPIASMHTAHHMLLYGCSQPGSSAPAWNCGEMASDESKEEKSPPCKDGNQIIYAWARDAPKLQLPQGVGFKVGGDSPIQYLVLQVHYVNTGRFKDGLTDNSGINLIYTEKEMSKLAGVILLGTSGFIPPRSEEHMETSCVVDEDKKLHPFAFRTHTHSLGRVVAGYRVRKVNGTDSWTLLGKRNPLEPEMFYPVNDETAVIEKNDTLAARCTMVSNRRTKTVIGATNKDEMCNFYLMYWVENTSPLNRKYCFTPGPPFYYWNKAGLKNIPEKDASTLI